MDKVRHPQVIRTWVIPGKRRANVKQAAVRKQELPGAGARPGKGGRP